MRMRGWCVALGVVGLACAGDPAAPAPLRSHAVLQYRAFNRFGMALVTGTLDLTVHEDSSLSGSWVLDWAPGADRSTPVGPQLGSGTFTGSRCADSWCLNLNQYSDNNVVLVAKSFDTGLQGTWSWSTIAGANGGGSFLAHY
jgi:hypothetical protein